MNKNERTNSTDQPGGAVRKTASRLAHRFRPLTKVWVVTLLLVAGLTLPTLSAFSFQSKDRETKDRSAKKVEIRDNRTPKAPQSADAAKHQSDAQRAIENGILGRIAALSNNALKKLPSASPFKNANPRDRIYLEKGRKLLEAGKSATRWNATQLINYANQLERYESEAAANVSRTAQESCGAAKDRCYRQCHATDGHYGCFFDCRLEYIACLIFSGGGGVLTQH